MKKIIPIILLIVTAILMLNDIWRVGMAAVFVLAGWYLLMQFDYTKILNFLNKIFNKK